VVDGNETNRKVALSVLKEKDLKIDVVSVVKDDRHKAKAIIGNKNIIDKYSLEIININAEAHRFAVRYHREKRSRAFLG
jgi:excinuclease UvrABC nuclease subunit